MRVKKDTKYHFISMFDSDTGFYFRTGIIKDGKDSGIDPFMASFPELIDVGIMGHCVNGQLGLCFKAGVECYQNGVFRNDPNMSVENFRRIAQECSGKTFQFALGGAGDPDLHENFEDILQICKENSIVPNFTSSGIGFTEHTIELCKKYCGAVAISWYRNEYTLKALNMLISAGVKTNIHYVVGNNTIDEAIDKLKHNSFPTGVNAVVFLLHKPVGLGSHENVLSFDDERVKEFFDVIDAGKFSYKVGFDSCFVPGILNFCHNIMEESVDTCEGGRWSMYITPDMKALPCSFDNQDLKWAYDLNGRKIEDAWYSEQFEAFRNHFRNSCVNCEKKPACFGGCPVKNEIVLCNRKKIYGGVL